MTELNDDVTIKLVQNEDNDLFTLTIPDVTRDQGLSLVQALFDAGMGPDDPDNDIIVDGKPISQWEAEANASEDSDRS